MNAVLRPADEPHHQQPWHRAMQLADLDTVVAIEAGAYSHPWTRGNFADSLASGYDAELRLDASGSILGYSVAMCGVNETHLLNLAVAAPQQRCGHGLALLQRVVQAARARGDASVWLEVRASNRAGLSLYAAFGFAAVGMRPNYYPLTHLQREDAVLMSLNLAPPAAAAHHALD